MAGQRQEDKEMTERPQTPPPAKLSKSPPIPEPRPPADETEALSPTRYGDWEKRGIAVDF